VRSSDFDRYAGHRVKVELAMPIAGRRRFKGILLGVEDACARVRQEATPGQPEDVLLPIADMTEAKLVLTDALVAESLRRGKAAERAARRGHSRRNSGSDAGNGMSGMHSGHRPAPDNEGV
jgi:ribosome maturation factor RimP